MDRVVSIAGLLEPDRIIVGLTAKQYHEAVSQLFDRLDAAGLISDRAAVEELVQAESALGDLPTVGRRALLAHYRTDAVRELAVAIGTSPSPFGFAPERAPNAAFLVLVVAPRAAAKYYLKTVAALSRLLRDPAVADSLAGAATPEAFIDVVKAKDLLVRPELMVQDLMSREFQAVSAETLATEALHLMVRHRRRGLPVVSDNGEVLGVVTEQDLLQFFLPQVLRATSPGADEAQPIGDSEVRDLMQRSVMCLSEDQLISDVLGAMLSEDLPQFPVVREGKLVGVLSRSDLTEKLLDPSL